MSDDEGDEFLNVVAFGAEESAEVELVLHLRVDRLREMEPVIQLHSI